MLGEAGRYERRGLPDATERLRIRLGVGGVPANLLRTMF